MGAARKNGFPVDEKIMGEQVKANVFGPRKAAITCIKVSLTWWKITSARFF